VTIDLPAASSDVPRSRADATSRTWVALLASAVLMFLVWRGTLFAFDLFGLSLTPGMGKCAQNW
jgi:hypothetical protein